MLLPLSKSLLPEFPTKLPSSQTPEIPVLKLDTERAKKGLNLFKITSQVVALSLAGWNPLSPGQETRREHSQEAALA